MADEEAEQERLSRGGGGCVAELQRLGERLQELERQLRESRVPAVEAATEYCQQLCQVRAPGGPLPLSFARGGSGRTSAWRPSGGRRLPWHRWRRRPGGSGQRTRLCVAAVVAVLSAAPGWGKGVVVRAENPPPLSFPEVGAPRSQPLQPARIEEGKKRMEARSSSSSFHCALGDYRARRLCTSASHSDGPPPPLV